jgi:hypothetical protein
MEPGSEIKADLKKLLAAIAHENYREAMKPYKALYTAGSPVIPFVYDVLFGLDLSGTASSRMKSKIEMSYVTGLVSLIHDIDENEAKKMAQQLIQKGCRDSVKQRLKSILEFSLDDFYQYEIGRVKIFEYKQIKTQFNIRSTVEKWFRNVAEDDLKEIDRIYIVNRTEYQDYAGYYRPIFYYINLVWDVSGAKFNPMTWLSLALTEMVLYHEIGHHVRRHTFGQIKEQEDEADVYAGRRFLEGRPVVYKTLEIVAKVVKLFRRKLKWKAVV